MKVVWPNVVKAEQSGTLTTLDYEILTDDMLCKMDQGLDVPATGPKSQNETLHKYRLYVQAWHCHALDS